MHIIGSGLGCSLHGWLGHSMQNSRLRTDTHLPYTVLVQRWWRSTLGRRVARRGHFQVSIGAAAPGETSFRAFWHSVSGWLLLVRRRGQWGSFYRCKVDLCGGPQNPQGSAGPGIILRRHTQSVMIRDKIWYSDSSRLTNQNERSLCSGMLPVCWCRLSVCGVEMWTRECASTKLRRINVAFKDSRKCCKRKLIRMVNLKRKLQLHFAEIRSVRGEKNNKLLLE